MSQALLFGLAALILAGCSGAALAATAEPTATAAPSNRSTPDTVVAEGRLVPGRHMILAFAGSGRVKEVLVQEGQTLEAGQVLARLEGAEVLLAQEAAAKLEIVQVEQALQELTDDTLLRLALVSVELETAQKAYDAAVQAWSGKTSTSPTAFETALRDYLDAETAVREAQKKLNDEIDQPKDAPTREQAEKDLTREQERRAKAYAALLTSYEDPKEGGETETRTALLSAITRLETARLELDKLAGGVDPDRVELLQARLEASQAAQVAAQEGLEALELRAPWNGTLVLWDVEAGEVVGPGQAVGAIIDPGAWFVETTDLTENGVVAVEIGAPVEITVNALPGQTFTGEVVFIQGLGEKYQGDMTYQVRIRLDQIDPHWYWNMNAKVTIGK